MNRTMWLILSVPAAASFAGAQDGRVHLRIKPLP